MKNNKKGFTIIELMLAMAFLGTMLMAIATLVMRITNIYQKGLALRGVNSIGRELISDLTRTIDSSPTNIKVNPEFGHDITVNDLKPVFTNYFLSIDNASTGEQYSGIFCTGSYSYVWNTAPTIVKSRDSDTANDTSLITLKLSDGTRYIPRFARFADRERFACEHNDGATVPKSRTIDLSASSTHERKMEHISELISNDETDLALYDFRVLPAAQNETTKQILYSGSFILATVRGGVNIRSNGDYCTGSDKAVGTEFTLNDFDYCAVNKFNFTARATGEAAINQHGDE